MGVLELLNFRSNKIGGYGTPVAMPSTEDYDVTAKEEPKGVTVFGPAFSPMKEAFDEHPTSKTSKVQVQSSPQKWQFCDFSIF